jgi:hypothetical protein
MPPSELLREDEIGRFVGVYDVLKLIASYAPSSTQPVYSATVKSRAKNNLSKWRKNSVVLAELQECHIAGYMTPVLRSAAEFDALVAAPVTTGKLCSLNSYGLCLSLYSHGFRWS